MIIISKSLIYHFIPRDASRPHREVKENLRVAGGVVGASVAGSLQHGGTAGDIIECLMANDRGIHILISYI